MKWVDCYDGTKMPNTEQIAEFIANPLWNELCSYLQSHYGVSPSVEYSTCCAAPGWNVKYKKSGRALCTLYPDDGFFTCLVTIGRREATQAELLLPSCTQSVQELYQNVRDFNGARWLMISVTSPEILNDVKQLIALRVKKKQS